jgi:hypothetical protein
MTRLHLAIALLAAVAAVADSPTRYERPLFPAGPGANLAAVDATLLSAAAPARYRGALAGESDPAWSGGLEDVRLFTASGQEIPYLLLPPPVRKERWETASVRTIAATKEASGFEAELTASRPITRVKLEGLPTPFLKRFRLEGSGDRARWSVLIPEGTLFDLPDERLRQCEASFPPGEFRYLRLTWDDRTSGRVPAPSHVSVRVEEDLPPFPAASFPVAFSRMASEPGRSRFHLKLPGSRLPVVALELGVGPGHLLRDARVTEARLAGDEVVPQLLGRAMLRQTTRESATASELRIPIEFPSGPDLDLVVEDGDNPPLELRSLTGVFAPLPAIWFEAPSAEPLVARFGDATRGAPRYDLEAARSAAARAPAAEARWGAVRDTAPGEPPAPPSPFPEPGAPVDRTRFRFSREIRAVKAGMNSLPLDAAVLAHGTLESLRIVSDDGRQVPYLLEKREEPLTLELAAPERVAAAGYVGRPSAYRVALPFAGLPASRLVLMTSSRVFERSVSATVTMRGEGQREERVETLARAVWRHVDPEGPAPPLVLALPSVDVETLTLNVDEGDNSPLPLAAPKLLLSSYRLRFYGGSGNGKTLLYGEPSLGPPRYDLALLAPRLVGVASNDATLGPEEKATAPRPALDQKLFWGILVTTILALLLLLGRSLRPAMRTGL